MLTFEEKQFIEKKLNENALSLRKDVFQCPQCQAFCLISGKKPSNNKISCKKCEILKKNHVFCSKCLHFWNNSLGKCVNIDCEDYEKEKEKLLNSGKLLIIGEKEVPSIRKCPFCGVIIEFFSKVKLCKTVVCLCGTRFCMICLRFTEKNNEKTLCWDEKNPNNEIDSLDQSKKCILYEK